MSGGGVTGRAVSSEAPDEAESAGDGARSCPSLEGSGGGPSLVLDEA